MPIIKNKDKRKNHYVNICGGWRKRHKL